MSEHGYFFSEPYKRVVKQGYAEIFSPKRSLRKRIREVTAEILDVVTEEDPFGVTSPEIAERLELGYHTVSNAIRKMVTQGLIKDSGGRDGRRIVWVLS